MADRRKVYHVYQKVVEYYIHQDGAGWVNVSDRIGEEWAQGTYDYVELRHGQAAGRNLLYGSHIRG